MTANQINGIDEDIGDYLVNSNFRNFIYITSTNLNQTGEPDNPAVPSQWRYEKNLEEFLEKANRFKDYLDSLHK